MTGEVTHRSGSTTPVRRHHVDAPTVVPLRFDSPLTPELRIIEPDGPTSASARLRRMAGLRGGRTGVPTPWGKRTFDIVGAILLGLAFSPFILLIVTTIRLGGKPVLFRHHRIGKDGKVFNCLKFRTMVSNAEEVLRKLLEEHPEIRDEWTENHKLRHDPRITAIGRLLRFTSLDELPQLWNVLRGDMSLVGPRPIVRAELLRYGREAPMYLSVTPGLTGLWQVKGRSDTTYRRRVAMDKYYVMHQCLLLDLYIVAATAGAVVKRAGAY